MMGKQQDPSGEMVKAFCRDARPEVAACLDDAANCWIYPNDDVSPVGHCSPHILRGMFGSGNRACWTRRRSAGAWVVGTAELGSVSSDADRSSTRSIRLDTVQPAMQMRGEYDPWVLCKTLDRTAKLWWGTALTIRVLGFGVGVLAVLQIVPAAHVVFVVAAVGIAAEMATFRSDRVRGVAQGLRRKLELSDGFGLAVSDAEYSDLLARSPASVKTRAKGKKLPAPYFASTKPAGAERTLENLSESSWWTKHLAETMRTLCAIVIAVAIATSFAMLIIAIERLTETVALDAVARIVTSVLLLVASLGFLRLIVGYHDLAVRAGRTEDSAERLKTGAPDATEVSKLLHEYQLSRATAPILPDWVWQLRQVELNALWKNLRTKP